jgi:large subunit ribosomal protein L18
MNPQKAKLKQRLRRRHHVRRKITGTVERPRLSVFRSSKHLYAQLIDDGNSTTLAAASSLGADVKYGGNIKAAQAVGKKLAEVAKEKGITKAAFDRGHYKYHGRVKALAEAATQGGLICCNPEKIGATKATAKEPAPEAQKAPKKEKKEKKEPKETKSEA